MSDLVKLRYLGEVETTFQDLYQSIQPQGTFYVPEEEAERYTRRADIELAGDEPEDEAPVEDKKPAEDEASPEDTPPDPAPAAS